MNIEHWGKSKTEEGNQHAKAILKTGVDSFGKKENPEYSDEIEDLLNNPEDTPETILSALQEIANNTEETARLLVMMNSIGEPIKGFKFVDSGHEKEISSIITLAVKEEDPVTRNNLGKKLLPLLQ
jgi:hypothetical protein